MHCGLTLIVWKAYIFFLSTKVQIYFSKRIIFTTWANHKKKYVLRNQTSFLPSMYFSSWITCAYCFEPNIESFRFCQTEPLLFLRKKITRLFIPVLNSMSMSIPTSNYSEYTQNNHPTPSQEIHLPRE